MKLTVHDPAVVAEYLVQWQNPNKDRFDTDQGYIRGSFFAWCCGKDREQNLKKLLNAKAPLIRVAGAVYLCFENPPVGDRKLLEFMQLKGDPGAWAALTLARRGNAAAITRALDVLATPTAYGRDGDTHSNLQKQLMVLLSNTAKHSGLPQPVLPFNSSKKDAEERQAELHNVYKSWWIAHRERATTYDPWLPILKKQKVD